MSLNDSHVIRAQPQNASDLQFDNIKEALGDNKKQPVCEFCCHEESALNLQTRKELCLEKSRWFAKGSRQCFSTRSKGKRPLEGTTA